MFLVGLSLKTPLVHSHGYLVVPRSILDAYEDRDEILSMMHLENQLSSLIPRLLVYFAFRGNKHKIRVAVPKPFSYISHTSQNVS